MADLITKIPRANGTNAMTNYVKSDCYIVDGGENADALAVGSHSIAVVPAGYAIVGVKLVGLDTATSSGSATLAVTASVGSASAVAVGSSLALTKLAKGCVNVVAPAGTAVFSFTEDTKVNIVVGTAAFTALNVAVIVDTIPIGDFQI